MRTYPTLREHVAHAFAPGRVNLIGEHTDYNAGLALPFAISAGVTVRARRREGDAVDVYAAELREHDSFSAGAPGPADDWRAFVRGAYAVLADGGLQPGGASIEIHSDLPRGVGLSSSAALGVAVGLCLIELSGEPSPEPLVLARLCQSVEQTWLGARTGLLDQLASLHGSAGQASLIDFQDLSVTPVPLILEGHRVVVLNSGGRDPDATAGYNRRRLECEAAAARVGAQTLRGAFIQDLHMLPDVLARRARHVIGENGRVLEAVEALQRGDLPALGALLDASHASLRDNFEVSSPALERAIRTLKQAGALPEGAFEVRACEGARLLRESALP